MSSKPRALGASLLGSSRQDALPVGTDLPHNPRNVLAALASMSARRGLAVSICRLQNTHTSTYIEQRNSL